MTVRRCQYFVIGLFSIFLMGLLVTPLHVLGSTILDDKELNNNRAKTASIYHSQTADIVVEKLSINVQVRMPHVSTWYRLAVTNTGESSVEYILSFALPEDSFLSNVSLTRGNTTVYGKVYPSNRARNIYANETAANRTASMIETSLNSIARSLRIRMNVGASERIVLGIQLEQVITRVLGEHVLEIPWHVFQEHHPQEVELNVSLFSSIAFSRVFSMSHPELNDLLPRPPFNEVQFFHATNETVLSQPLILTFSLMEAYPNGITFLTTNGTHDFFMFSLAPWVGPYNRFYKKFVFVLDTSGSMGKDDKIQQAKQALIEILKLLDPQDQFNLVLFSTTVRVYEKNAALLPADANNVQEAIDFVNTTIKAEGQTNFNGALLTALKLMLNATEEGIPGVPIVVVLSDGLPSIGETRLSVIRNNVRNLNSDVNVSINTIAFGNDANKTFLKQIAKENHGESIFIDPSDESSSQILDFYRRFATPLLTNVEFSFSPHWVIAPTWREINIYNGSEAVLFGMAPSETSLTITIKALTQNGTISLNPPIINKYTDKTFTSFLPHLWAFERIKDLLLQMSLQGETEALINETTALALEYGLVTPYTSIVLVFSSDDHSNVDEHQPRMTSDDFANEVGGEFANSTDYISVWWVNLSLLLIIVAKRYLPRRRTREDSRSTVFSH